MTWPYAYTPQIWPLVFTVLALIALAIYSFRRRSVPGALPFTFALLFSTLWTIGISLEIAAVDLSAKIFWVEFQTAMLLPTATSVTCFVLEYAWPGRWLTHRNLTLLSIPCLLYIGIILTNNLHHLAWQGFALDWRVVQMRGLGNWIFLIYAYGLTIINLVVLVWLFIRSPQQRWPAVLMITGQIGVRVVYMLGVLQVIHPSLPIEVFAFWIPIPMYVIALFGFRIFDPIPLARQIVIDQMRDGMLVLDTQGRVVSLNPAASKIIAAPLKYVRGKQVEEILPGLSLPLIDTALSKPIETMIGLGIEARCFELESSTLDDFRGIPVGRLLLLHDVTEQRRSQAQMLEQQRALSMLHEREQLARELHDGLGQVLGYTGLRMEAIRKLIADGKLATADDQLLQLENFVADAHADVRESILNLRNAPNEQRPFFSTLQHYLDGFLKSYGIRVDLLLASGVEEGIFTPEGQVQLFRIIQEAFSNARKHALASCIHLSFETEDGRVCVRIQDNGKGFDPTQVASEGHFGLRIMRERAEQLGGHLRVDSTPGLGTSVEVEVPVAKEIANAYLNRR